LSTVLVVYYSKTGMTQKMAVEVARGIKEVGVHAISKTVTECTIADLASVDGLAFGTPTHYSNIAWQSKRFLDETILDFYSQGYSLKGKPCVCFTSTGTFDDGKECLRMLELAFGVALKMQLLPGVILESTENTQEKISKCSEIGQRIAQQVIAKPQ
jgi:multimeric flavodoxin WrbA